MRAQRVSQYRIARVLGYSRQALSRRITGQIPFDVAELEKIAAQLGVPMSQFLPVARAA